MLLSWQMRGTCIIGIINVPNQEEFTTNACMNILCFGGIISPSLRWMTSDKTPLDDCLSPSCDIKNTAPKLCFQKRKLCVNVTKCSFFNNVNICPPFIFTTIYKTNFYRAGFDDVLTSTIDWSFWDRHSERCLWIQNSYSLEDRELGVNDSRTSRTHTGRDKV